MPKNEEYIALIQGMDWAGLSTLWSAIKNGDTPGWSPGKAFEYLILRMLEIDGAIVEWPYEVRLYGQTEVIEQIDGSARIDGLYCLIESKDESGDIAIGPIAKLRNQLLRRPSGTFGMVFSSQGFTESAKQLTQFVLPQAILLWTGSQVEYALDRRSICQYCERKYRVCVDEGIVDFDITEGGIV